MNIFSILSAALVAVSSAVAPEPAPDVATVLIRAFPDAPYVSEEGGFSIEFPTGYGEPRVSDQEIESDLGNLNMKMFMSTSANGAAMVAYVDYPEEVMSLASPKAMLDSGEAGALNNMPGAKVSSRKNIKLNGHPGRSIVFSTSSQGIMLYGRFDFYIVNARLYEIFFASNKKKDLDTKSVKNYFKSFTLTPSVE